MQNTHNNGWNNIDYRNHIPRNGFVFKFIKKENHYIHTFIEGDFIKKLNLSPSMVVGKTLFDFLSKKVATQKNSYYERAWNGETVNYDGELNGFHYVASLNPLIINGEVVRVNGTAIDITNEKRNETKIREMEKLSIVGELAAGIAHEIRNPLTSLTGFTQIIMERVEDEDLQEYLSIMLGELDRINNIVNEFMFIAKPKENMEVRSTHIHSLISHVIKFMEPQSNLKGIRIDFDSQSPITAECDPNHIKQVLINLIQNAIEASSDTSEFIKISLNNIPEEKYLIEIIDRGSGISNERIKRLFEPFYTTKEKGTGLGLMICRRIIDLHKGTIEINSDLGAGTVAKIILPKTLH
ncbi:ATP-binding protein [Peribacillus sp. SCS-155]|uniref:ATP-binding protein n=1 Tax=Peribacillus sedimenti TaxID=3115297 RepID=UPI003905B1B8